MKTLVWVAGAMLAIVAAGDAHAQQFSQAPNTTKAYKMSEAGGEFNVTAGVTSSTISAANAGGTITLTTNASGAITHIGANFTKPAFSISAAAGPLTATTLANIAAALQTTPGAEAIVLLPSNPNVGAKTFSGYGVWERNDGGGNFGIGVAAGGIQTPVKAMPTTGTATYTGTTAGVGAQGNVPFAFAGNAFITANFVTEKVGAAFTNLIFENLNTGATGTLTPITGSATITGNRFSGTVVDGATRGMLRGGFYGPAARETAGVYRLIGGGVTAVGSFGAHK